MASLATTAAFGFSDFDPPVILDLYRRMGCRSCQFYRNEANPPTVADAIAITQDAGLPIDSIHGVFGDDYDPASPDEDKRRESVEVYKAEGELAVQLGGPVVVVHPSIPCPNDHVVTAEQRQVRIDPLRKSIEELTAFGRKAGVVYVWENNPNDHWIGNDPLQLADMLRQINDPHARMCFDTGHANMTGSVDDRLAQCADVISYLHIHDNDGQVDDHRMPGDGLIDWPATGKAIESCAADTPAMLEVFYMADKLRRLVNTDLPANLASWLNCPADAKAGAASAQ